MIGRRYALVGGVNFALLAVFALTDGILGGSGPPLNAECALLPLLFGLVAVQGAFSAGAVVSSVSRIPSVVVDPSARPSRCVGREGGKL